MVAASGFLANILFLLQLFYFAASNLLHVVELPKLPLSGVAASCFAANGLNLAVRTNWVPANGFAASAHTPYTIRLDLEKSESFIVEIIRYYHLGHINYIYNSGLKSLIIRSLALQ